MNFDTEYPPSWAAAVTEKILQMDKDFEALSGKLRAANKRIKALEELVLRTVDDGR